jgi:pimeloyl-ACP methyl ester carboxylesterase
MTAPRDRIAVGSASLEMRWVGPRPDEAPTIVMLHEGLGSVAQWGEFPDRLAESTGCGMCAYSRAGYGGSTSARVPRPLTYMHDEALHVLPVVLTAIGFRRGVLLGHSDGASIATIYAGGIQDHRVRGLVLIAPHFFVEDISVASIARAKTAYETGDLRARLARYHGENVDAAFWGWNRAWLDPQFRQWDIRDYIDYVRVPIQIVQGEDDQYGTTAQIDAALEEAYCPVDVALIPGARHAPQNERPSETLRAVTDFILTLLDAAGEAAPLHRTELHHAD